MPYSHFRYIAYEVPTVMFKRHEGFNCGKPCDDVPRLPLAVLPDDLNCRLKRLAAVIDLAANHLTAQQLAAQQLAAAKKASGELEGISKNQPNILNIFMAPESYFKPGEGHTPPRFYTYQELVALLAALKQMVEKYDFSNWLFVPGTVMWNDADNSEWSKINNKFSNYFNTLLYIRGGPEPAVGVKAVRQVEKAEPSTADMLASQFQRAAGFLLKNKKDDEFEKFYSNSKSIGDGNRVFDVEQTSIGFEICKEHDNGVLEQFLKTREKLVAVEEEEEKSPEGCNGVSLHVLTAAGTSIAVNKVAARTGGYVLFNNGQANLPGETEGKPGSQLMKREESGKLETIVAERVIPIPKGNMQLPTKVKVLEKFTPFDQRIVIYPPQVLPK